MKRSICLPFIVVTLVALFSFFSSASSMPSKTFDIHERHLKLKGSFEVIEEVVFKPGEEKIFTTYSYKPVTIDFRTNLSKAEMKKVKNDGIGMKKVANLNYYIVDPLSASMDVVPENGMVKIRMKNFENFPITVKLYRISDKKV